MLVSLIHTTCIAASVNLVASNFKCMWEPQAVPLLSFNLFTMLTVRHWKWWWALQHQVAFAESCCVAAPATFLSHEATDSCTLQRGALSEGNSWRGDSCHTLMARCVRMAASVSVTEWDAASYELCFLRCAGLAWSLAKDKPFLSHSWEFGERFLRVFYRVLLKATMTQ